MLSRSQVLLGTRMRAARFEGMSNCLEVVVEFPIIAVWNVPTLLSVFLSTAIASTTSCRLCAGGNAINLILEDFGLEPLVFLRSGRPPRPPWSAQLVTETAAELKYGSRPSRRERSNK